MPKVTDQELAHIVRRNIVSLCEGKKNARAQIAKECAVSPSMVTKWTTEANPYIPGALYLLTIADMFGVTVDWLLTKHDDHEQTIRLRTYADALRMYSKLYENRLILQTTSQDMIMLHFIRKLENSLAFNVESDDVAKWLNDMMLKFKDVAICSIEMDVQAYIYDNTPGIRTMDEDTSMYNLGMALMDETIVDAAKEAIKEAEEKQQENPRAK